MSIRLALAVPSSLVLATLLAGQAQAANPPAEVEARAFYGRGFDFWSKVDTLTHGSAAPDDLIRALDSSFDRSEEGIASLAARYQGPADQAFAGIADQAYFGIGADLLAGGIARNRILPRVHAYQSFTGHADFGLAQPLPAQGSGWEFGLGTTLGAGSQTRIDESMVNMISDFAPNSSFVFYTGLDAHLGFRSRFSDTLQSRYRLSARPTLYHSDFSGSASQYRLETDQFAFRWRQHNEWTLTLDSAYEPAVDFGVHTTLGQQPVPVALLPRAWDAIHSLEAWPAFGQLVGLGTSLHVHASSADFGAAVSGGFYGGYLGCGARLHLLGLEASAGTYGLEQSPGYRIEQSRIEYVMIGGSFAL